MKDQEQKIQQWVQDQLKLGHVPRLRDVVDGLRQLRYTRRDIRRALLKMPEYQAVLPQQRPPGGSRRRRMIATPTLGYYHADIGFYAVQSKYPTPKKYQSGFLVLVDSVSRYVLVDVLPFNRLANTVITVLQRLFKRHQQVHRHPVRGLSFDQERSIMSRKVQTFLKEQHITFRDFMYSSSKAKLAENTIGRIRATMAVLEATTNKPWWTLLSRVESILNQQPLVLYGQVIPNGVTPASVTEDTLPSLQAFLETKTPASYFGRFNLDPAQFKFQYNIGDTVKAKTIVISSQVLGPKRKIHQLADPIFKIVQRYAYARLNMTIGLCYAVVDKADATQRVHVFEEEEIVRI